MWTHENERRDLTCLALNVYFEARGEPEAGHYAVAEVTMNRVASRRYPNTVCGVVYEKRWDRLRGRYVSAFSWTEFDTRPSPKSDEFQRAWRIAEEVYYGRHTPVANGALWYHATRVRPSWAREHVVVARIGRHIFYR
jgi:spore germination cell wall hydrolase CwlJ-like protein